MSEELRSCPFCGNDKVYEHIHNVYCPKCKMSYFGDAWNTRPLEDALRQQLEAAQERIQYLTGLYDRQLLQGMDNVQQIITLQARIKQAEKDLHDQIIEDDERLRIARERIKVLEFHCCRIMQVYFTKQDSLDYCIKEMSTFVSCKPPSQESA